MNIRKLYSILLIVGLTQVYVFTSVMNGLAIKTWNKNIDYFKEELGLELSLYIEIGLVITIPIFAACMVSLVVKTMFYDNIKWKNKKEKKI